MLLVSYHDCSSCRCHVICCQSTMIVLTHCAVAFAFVNAFIVINALLMPVFAERSLIQTMIQGMMARCLVFA